MLWFDRDRRGLAKRGDAGCVEDGLYVKGRHMIRAWTGYMADLPALILSPNSTQCKGTQPLGTRVL